MHVCVTLLSLSGVAASWSSNSSSVRTLTNSSPSAADKTQTLVSTRLDVHSKTLRWYMKHAAPQTLGLMLWFLHAGINMFSPENWFLFACWINFTFCAKITMGWEDAQRTCTVRVWIWLLSSFLKKVNVNCRQPLNTDTGSGSVCMYNPPGAHSELCTAVTLPEGARHTSQTFKTLKGCQAGGIW